MKQTSVPKRQKFDLIFKREAVQNWLNSGKSAAIVGEELGIKAIDFMPGGSWSRRRWGRATAAKPGSMADLQGQLDAAQRELRHVREQCTI